MNNNKPTIVFRYVDYGHKETTEFREYIKNLIGYIQSGVEIYFTKEEDPMFDTKVVAVVSIDDEEVAVDVANHFMMDREIKGENVPFDVDFSSVAVNVVNSNKVDQFITSRSLSSLYERVDILETMVHDQHQTIQDLQGKISGLTTFIQQIGADKFPDIVKALTESMEFEGHQCKQNINDILQRKVH